MFEYLPWSNETHRECLKKYLNGTFSCLDIELGGCCNYHCVYCDSPDRKKQCNISFKDMERIISEGNFDWVFICGLGEPTFKENYQNLLVLLGYCKKYNMKCSVFSNFSNLTKELLEYIDAGILHVLYKYDSFDVNTIKMIYGTKKAKEQIENIKLAKSYVRTNDEHTNFAASIVPTKLNKDFIIPIVEECLESRIFPLIGELELSGKGQINYENLSLEKEELLEIKENVEKIIGKQYDIPICPSIISGIHFNSNGNITVDEYTGLSCHWFWLEEPKVKTLLTTNEHTSLYQIQNAIFTYRDSQLYKIEDYLKSLNKVGLAFGGCGGDVNKIFTQYLEHYYRR